MNNFSKSNYIKLINQFKKQGYLFKDTEKWDSLGHMKLIGIIEKKIKRKLLSKEIFCTLEPSTLNKDFF